MSLDLPDALTDRDDGYYVLPPTLRRVCILLDVCHRCTWGSNQSHCYRCQILMLANMDHRVVLLDHPGDDIIGHKSCQMLVDEWQERMNGGEVFWEEQGE